MIEAMFRSNLTERCAAELECELSYGAVIPVLGALPAVTKIALGMIQSLGALLALAYSISYIHDPLGRQGLSHAFSHIVNGMANAVAGCLEALPIIGSCIAIVRLWRIDSAEKGKSNDQEHMFFVGYRHLLTAASERRADMSCLPLCCF